MRAVPTLDLQRYRRGRARDRAQFAHALRAGLCDLGFVVVEGHGIEPSLVRSVYAHFARFFARPEAEKAACAGVDGGQRGFTPFGVEHAKDSASPDLKEFFHVGQPHPSEAFADSSIEPSIAAEIATYPRNVWPDASDALAADSMRMFRALERLSCELLRALAEGFELPRDAFASMLRGGNSILRALHYPPVGADAPAGSVRAAPHEDINLVTLLCEAGGAGLEIRATDSRGAPRWLPVDAGPGRIVVDSGDMLSRMTNGVVPATTHRVVNPPRASNEHRYSLPFFAHPRPSCDLSVLDAFVSRERPRAFPPTTAGAFLLERLEEIGLIDARRR